MNSWEILGIEPTTETALIRRAYASQLKNHRPDSDPEGYQQLREAFEWAKNSASEQQFDESMIPEAETAVITLSADEISTVTELAENPGSFALQLSCVPVYSAEETEELAYGLVENGTKNLAALGTLFDRVTQQGTLLQQQQFHQDLAAALGNQPGLTEWLVEQVSELLGWGLTEYSSSYLVPQSLQYALYAQVHITESERAWKKVEIEQTHGELLDRMALNLLLSERASVPFWVHLIPDLVTKMARQTNTLYATFPELTQRFNPNMLEFINTPQRALSWQGIFLLAFWGTILIFTHNASPLSVWPELITGGLIIYYLFLSDLILMGSQRLPRLTGAFLLVDCLCSLLILSGLFAAVLYISINSLSSHGEGFSGLLPVFVILLEWMVLWSLWSKNVPGLRRPGVAVAALFTSPWRLLKTLDFSVMAFPLAAVYGLFCYFLLHQLMKIPASFL